MTNVWTDRRIRDGHKYIKKVSCCKFTNKWLSNTVYQNKVQKVWTSKRIWLKHLSFVMQRQKDILYKLMLLLFRLLVSKIWVGFCWPGLCNRWELRNQNEVIILCYLVCHSRNSCLLYPFSFKHNLLWMWVEHRSCQWFKPFSLGKASNIFHVLLMING